MTSPGRALGLDFGTTNSVVARSGGDGSASLVTMAGAGATGAVFRSALCFWQDEDQRKGPASGLGCEAGPWAIAEYLDFPLGCRFIQSFKTVAASPTFDSAPVFNRRLRFEELGQLFLEKLVGHAGGALADLPPRIVVGRPVNYAGARPDPELARERYDRMFDRFGTGVHYVYEPMGAAFSYAARLDHPATLLVADFGGGTSDFSVVRLAEPGAKHRCIPLGSAGIGIAGDRFDARIVEHLVLPILGKGSSYRSFDKVLEIPAGYFTDFADWSRLALMRNRKTMDELARLHRSAVDPEAIGRMIAIIENEQGFPLYDAVGQLKRALSGESHARFRFAGAGITIEAEVARADFESWIAEDLARIDACVDEALVRAGVTAGEIDRVFITGGSSLVPAIQAIFHRRFGAERIAAGDELTAIAHGLALIGEEDDMSGWTA